jgi:polar amino acid transport system substrate-binding protein
LPSDIELLMSESGLLTLTQPSRKGWPCVYELAISLNQVFIDFQGSDDSDEVMRRFLPPVK